MTTPTPRDAAQDLPALPEPLESALADLLEQQFNLGLVTGKCGPRAMNSQHPAIKAAATAVQAAVDAIRAALAAQPAPEAQPVAQDWLLRSRVADLLHLLEFSGITSATGTDDVQAQKAMADLRRMLTSSVAQTAAEPSADPDECEHFCPHCGGSGEVEEADSAGPDARMLPANCPHCEGKGTLIAAYRGAVKLLAAEHQKYMKACTDLYFLRQAAHAQQPAPALGECDECGTPYSPDPTDGGAICVRCVRETLNRLHAQQPAALTDAQIVNPYRNSRGAASIWMNGFRAAERAHGIHAATQAPTTDTECGHEACDCRGYCKRKQAPTTDTGEQR